MSYCPNTPDDIREMLAAIGVGGIDDLFAPIPAALRARSFDLPTGMSEFEMLRRLRDMADCTTQCVIPFVGGGYYDHAIPAVIDHLSGRAEFYTAYTPYQPECSQGTLQALFEYQTAICELTGLEASNASLYDGGTALAEAAMMALRATGRNQLVVDGGVNPATRAIIRTYIANMDIEMVEVPPVNGISDRNALSAAMTEQTAALLVQNPNFFGSLDDLSDLADAVHSCGGLLVASVYPISLGLVKSPADMGVDIAVGDGQSLGNPLSFGGPSFGFITARKKFIRNMPGRIIGETVDRQGRRGFVLTLQAREQHIKRHKATSNICSNQSLCAVRGLIYLASIGRQGFAELARLNYDKAEYAKSRLAAIGGVSILNVGTTFNEFTVALPVDASKVVEKLLAQNVAAGVPLGDLYAGMERCMTVTVTEQRSKQEIDLLAQQVEAAL